MKYETKLMTCFLGLTFTLACNGGPDTTKLCEPSDAQCIKNKAESSDTPVFNQSKRWEALALGDQQCLAPTSQTPVHAVGGVVHEVNAQGTALVSMMCDSDLFNLHISACNYTRATVPAFSTLWALQQVESGDVVSKPINVPELDACECSQVYLLTGPLPAAHYRLAASPAVFVSQDFSIFGSGDPSCP